MKPSPESEENLERFVSAALRDLPARPAPRSLESRVLAELERRAALAWWHKSFPHWPVAMRGVFFVLSAGVAAFVVMSVFAMTHSSAAERAMGEVTARFAWLELASIFADSLGALYRAIPPLWLYSVLGLFAASYALLVGVGAAAYRAFAVQR